MSSMIRTADGRELNLHVWAASQAPPAITVGLIHGYGEHAGRYAHVAEKLNARGISVLGIDLRGHGKSSGVRGHIEKFDEYHKDIDALRQELEKRAAGGPIALVGHSMGALVAADYLIAKRGAGLAGVVLSSPFLGLSLAVNPVKEAVGRAMSRFIPTLALPAGLKGSDVCRDPSIAALYDSDPLNNKKATARWFTEAMLAIERVHARAGEIALPVLLLYGGSDRVASADATDRFASKLKGKDVTFERLKDHYHEIVNELPEARDKVIDRIGAWLVDHARAGK
jgi:alpha-beta hydrolase superfamily lysophospholipase